MSDEDVRKAAATLKAKALFDHRFQVTYEESIAMGVTALTRYFAALQRRDPRGMAAQMHFPHAAVEGTDIVVVESEEDFLRSPPASMDVSSLPAGVFELLMGIETHTSDPVRAGLTMSYSRHKADGQKMVVIDGLYVVTNNEGRWGIEVSSMIATPIEHIGIQHQEAIDAVFKRGRDWMEGWSVSDGDLLDSTRGLLGRSVSLYPNITARREGLDHAFRTEGVNSRLDVTETTAVRPGTYNFPNFRQNVAGHGIGGYAYTLYRPDARVLHQSVNKVHVAGGYTRFQADGTTLSITHSLAVHVRRKGQWGSVGGTGNTIHYDATNNTER